MFFYSGSDSHDGGTSPVTLWSDASGELVVVSSVELRSPSWVVAHPWLPVLYVTEESEQGAVAVVAIDDRGQLTVQQRVDSHGSLPCHLAVNAAATELAVSNYLDGVVTILTLTAMGAIGEPHGVWQLTGTGPNAARQECAHAHASYYRGDSLQVVDLGSDAISTIAEDGRLTTALRLAPGFGPRHLVDVRDGLAVVVGELTSELALVDLTPGQARVLHTVPTTAGVGSQPSGIAARGDSVIVANRGVGTIAEFLVEKDHLVHVDEVRLAGDAPRAIASDGERIFVCIQDTGVLATYPPTGIRSRPSLAPAPHIGDFGMIPTAVAASITA